MKFVVTKSNTILGKLITWGLNEPVSHFSLVFDDSFVIQSNLLGVHLSWYKTLCKKSVSYYEIDMPLQLEEEEAIYRSIMNKFDGKPYDFKAFVKFFWMGFKYKFFKIPIEPRPKTSSNDAYLCTEIMYALPDWLIPAKVKDLDLGLISPWMLFNILVEEIKNHDPEQ